MNDGGLKDNPLGQNSLFPLDLVRSVEPGNVISEKNALDALKNTRAGFDSLLGMSDTDLHKIMDGMCVWIWQNIVLMK